MPTPEVHVNVTAPAISGVVSTGVSYLFDIPLDLVVVVFFGTLIGAMFRPAPTIPVGALDRAMLFIVTCCWLVAMTCLSSWAIPEILVHVDAVSQKAVAAFTGLSLMVGKDHIVSIINGLFQILLKAISRGSN